MDLFPKLISFFLQYPDDGLMKSLDGLEGVVPRLQPESVRGACTNFLHCLRGTPLVRLQEEYTRTFDLNPSLCLNLSHHKWGDNRARAWGLTALSGLYRAAGFEMNTSELPDYLPLVLEFLSVCPEGAGEVIKADYKDQVLALAERAEKGGSRYAVAVHLAAEVFKKGEG